MPRTSCLTSDSSSSRSSLMFGCIVQASPNGREPVSQIKGGATVENKKRLREHLAGSLLRRAFFVSAFVTATCAMGQSTPNYTFSNWQPLGTTSPSATVTITSQATGAVSSVQVVTMGTSGLEYADAGGACATFNFTAADQSCTESVTFTPKYPGTRLGAIVLLGSGNTVLGTGFLSGVGQGGLGLMIPGELTTVVGSGDFKVVQNGPALSAGLYLPTSLTEDGAGDMYIADSLHNMIRKVDTTQTVSTIAGNGAPGYSGDNGPAASSMLSTPSGVAMDGAGNLYIADTGNNVIREIVLAGSQATPLIRTIAGTGVMGNGGDGGPATVASLNQPLGVTVDAAGDLYIADTGNNRIRRVDAKTGIISNIAGSPNGTAGYLGDKFQAASALLNGPDTVAFDRSGNMYIPDSLNNVVRIVYVGGIIDTFAGGGTTPIAYGPSPTEAVLNLPTSVAVDPAQNIYIADTQSEAIRKVYAGGAYFDTFTELGTAGDFFNGTTYQAPLGGPEGMIFDGKGNLIFADAFNNRIREVQSNRVVLDYTGIPTHVGDTSAPQYQYIENDGNDTMTVSSITPDANSTLDPTVQNACAAGVQYGPISSCQMALEFKPTTTGDPLIAHVDLVTDSVDSPYDIELVGNAIPPSNTTTTLTAIPNPSVFEQSVVFSATVAAVPAAGSNVTNLGTPGGTVNFFSDGTSIGSSTLDSTGRATLTYSALTVGTHAITASYGGATDYLASSSAPLSQVVQKMPTNTSLGASGTGASTTSAVLVATVIGTTSTTPVPTGTVTFMDGSTTLGTAPVNASGVATLNPQLQATSYTITATYSGDAVHDPSTSVAVTVTGTPTDFGITVTPSKLTLAASQNATVTVTITSNDGYSDTIGLGCATVPAGVTCHFANNSVALNANGTQTVQLTIDTNNPLSGGASAMNAKPGRGLMVAGIFLPAGLLFPFFFRRFRRKGFVLLAALVICLSGTVLISGCAGGFSKSSATPGTYTLQVTGLGVNSNVAHYQAVTLTITK